MLLVLAASSMVAACGGDSHDPSRKEADEAASERTTSSSGSSVDPVAETDVEMRYKAFWDARFTANSPPNPDDPALPEYATGEQLDHVRSETQEHLTNGVEFRKADHPVNSQKVKVVEVKGDTAVVQECVVKDGVVFRSATGEIVDDRVTTYNVHGEMVRVDGKWKVARVLQVQSWDGVAGCALAD